MYERAGLHTGYMYIHFERQIHINTGQSTFSRRQMPGRCPAEDGRDGSGSTNALSKPQSLSNRISRDGV
jgi:hypothetical protein